MVWRVGGVRFSFMTMRWMTTVALSTTVLFSAFSMGCAAEHEASAPVVTPATPSFAAALEPKLAEVMTDTLAPGGAVLVVTPEGTWSKAWGVRALGSTEAVQTTDQFRVGSNTKTMTGTVVLQLVEEGRLRLEDPISKFYAGIPNGDRITIAHLLEMRSGIPSYSTTMELSQAIDTTPNRVWQPKELVELALTRKPSFDPGAGYEYSNTNTVLLGMIIEELTQQPVEQAFQTRIFDRLGMKNTTMPSLGTATIPGTHPQGYMFGTNVETHESSVLPQAKQDAARAGTFLPWNATNVNPSWGWTAGAAISTASDLAIYAEALSTGGLLGAEMQETRMKSMKQRDPGSDFVMYGLGLAKIGPVYGHTGQMPGFNSVMGHDPVKKITVITWTSLNSAPDGRAPAEELAKVVIGELYAK